MIELLGRGIAALVRSILVPVIVLWAAGCTSIRTETDNRPRVSVSAANYAQLTDEQLFTALNPPYEAPTKAPAVHQPVTAHHYLLLPGEVYPNDVPMDTVYHEVALVLERRGYFDAEFEKRAGRAPAAIDYLLRVHYGERLWLIPTVRGDRITWGNDGLVDSRYNLGLMNVPDSDPRVGLTPEEAMATWNMFNALRAGYGVETGASGNLGAGNGLQSISTANALQMQYEQATAGFWGSTTDRGVGRKYYLIVIEAFRFDDVVKMHRKAPCAWAVFIAVPVDQSLKFSDVLRGMLEAATPYFGETTHGLQISEVPPGKVTIGNPKVAP